MPAKYIVIEEHTLAYRLPNAWGGVLHWAGVLHGSVLRGGFDWKNGPIPFFPSRTRPATTADFAAYRVQLPPDFTQPETA